MRWRKPPAHSASPASASDTSRWTTYCRSETLAAESTQILISKILLIIKIFVLDMTLYSHLMDLCCQYNQGMRHSPLACSNFCVHPLVWHVRCLSHVQQGYCPVVLTTWLLLGTKGDFALFPFFSLSAGKLPLQLSDIWPFWVLIEKVSRQRRSKL